MPKKLISKSCKFCNAIILGRKRADRKAYYYPERCEQCSRKALDPKVLAIKRQQLEKGRAKITLPIGSKRLHKVRTGLCYVQIKIGMPNRWAYEHRVVMNAPKGMHVHHINGNTIDNRPENLAILSHQDHQRLHCTLTKWSRLYDACIDCKTTVKKHLSKGLCTTCYQRKS